jgi:hypothetical protein
MKCESLMPRRAASAFILATKPCCEPPTVSATAMARSFADLTSIIFIALSSVSFWPGLKYIFAGGCAAASFDMTTGVSSLIWPDWIARKVT